MAFLTYLSSGLIPSFASGQKRDDCRRWASTSCLSLVEADSPVQCPTSTAGQRVGIRPFSIEVVLLQGDVHLFDDIAVAAMMFLLAMLR